MERDKKLEKLIREHSLISAPENFTDLVINKVSTPLTASYKPLISKKGWIYISAVFALVIVLAIVGVATEASEPILNIPEWNFTLPEWNYTLPEIDWKVPSGILAGLVAILLLVLMDARLTRSRTN